MFFRSLQDGFTAARKIPFQTRRRSMNNSSYAGLATAR